MFLRQGTSDGLLFSTFTTFLIHIIGAQSHLQRAKSKSESESRSVVSDSLRPHGILQARILEWVAVLFSKGSSQLRDQTQVSHTVGRFFTSWATREAPKEPKSEAKDWITTRDPCLWEVDPGNRYRGLQGTGRWEGGSSGAAPGLSTTSVPQKPSISWKIKGTKKLTVKPKHLCFPERDRGGYRPMPRYTGMYMMVNGPKPMLTAAQHLATFSNWPNPKPFVFYWNELFCSQRHPTLVCWENSWKSH